MLESADLEVKEPEHLLLTYLKKERGKWKPATVRFESKRQKDIG